MDFNNKPPEWKNAGVEPPEETRAEGFRAGYRPPASYFNWFWSLAGRCIKELQEKLSAYVTSNDNVTGSISDALDGHKADTVKHATSAERTLWNTVSGKVDKVTGKGLSSNDYTTAEKDKLSGIEAGANHYVHPSHPARASGLYKIAVDAAGHVSGAAAVAKGDITGLGIPAQDTVYTHPATHPAGMITGLAKVAASGSYNDLSNKPAIPGIPPALPPSGAAGGDLSGTYPNPSVKDNSHAHTIANVTGLQTAIDGKAGTTVATTTTNGLMAAADKAKLNGIATGATKYVHPAYTARNAGMYKVTVDSTGHVSAVAAIVKGDITALGIPSQDTIYTHPSSHPASMITGLATVATTGSYNSLSNKPTIPAVASYTATISTTWSGSAAPYTQVVTVSGLLTTDKQVHITPNYSATLATAQAQQEAWNLVSKGDVTANNQITFTCFGDKPVTAVPIKLEVTR